MRVLVNCRVLLHVQRNGDSGSPRVTGSINLKKSVDLNPTENVQHKFDKPTGGMI
jgi:hypothetical protein